MSNDGVTVYTFSTVKDPFTGRFLGIATSTTKEGIPATIYTVDEQGNMQDFIDEASALLGIQETMTAAMNFKFSHPDEIDRKQLGCYIKEAREYEKYRRESPGASGDEV